ncbi:MAG: acyltransferase [bacterium]
MRRFGTHGDGAFSMSDFKSLGDNVVIEAGVMVFQPETIEIGDNVYIGHMTILKGYPGGTLRIGNDTWIGQQCFLHGGGGLEIGSRIGIGPGARFLTSDHEDDGSGGPLLDMPLRFAKVTLEDECHIGASATILPGVTIGRGAQVAAGAVVAADAPPLAVVAGVPARVIRMRGKN